MIFIASREDPFLVNEYPPSGNPQGVGFSNTRGRTLVSSIVADRANTKIVILDGQSEHATADGTATYLPASSQAHQLNIYDGGIYLGRDPVLGASVAPQVGPSSVIMRIADRIIARGKATRVVMVPIAIGGTPWAIYDPAAAGNLFTRVRAAIRRLSALGLSPDDIIAARGATDNNLGTSAASITNSIWAWTDGVRALGCTAAIWLGKFTMSSGVVSTTVQTGIANAIDAGRNIKIGYDGDTNLTVAGGYRLDGTHLSDLGLTTAANGWADLVYP